MFSPMPLLAVIPFAAVPISLFAPRAIFRRKLPILFASAGFRSAMFLNRLATRSREIA